MIRRRKGRRRRMDGNRNEIGKKENQTWQGGTEVRKEGRRENRMAKEEEGKEGRRQGGIRGRREENDKLKAGML
jgi:hypothetical protein